MTEFTEWPASARALLDRAIQRYGGDAGRERLGAIGLEPTSIGGLLLWLKGLGKSFRLPARAEIDGRAARAILQAARLLSFDERARWVRVEFPPHVHTHSARQTFYFDESGLIVRHDYVAEVVGWWARAAHYWLDYADVRGVPVAYRRLAYARLGRLRLPIVAVDVRFR